MSYGLRSCDLAGDLGDLRDLGDLSDLAASLKNHQWFQRFNEVSTRFETRVVFFLDLLWFTPNKNSTEPETTMET